MKRCKMQKPTVIFISTNRDRYLISSIIEGLDQRNIHYPQKYSGVNIADFIFDNFEYYIVLWDNNQNYTEIDLQFYRFFLQSHKNHQYILLEFGRTLKSLTELQQALMLHASLCYIVDEDIDLCELTFVVDDLLWRI